MSIFVKITVAEPSVVIRSGILAVLRQMTGVHADVYEVGDADRIRPSLAWQKPDIFLVNPAMSGLYTPARMRKESGNPDMRCAALLSSLTDSSALKAYDEVISVYDNLVQIREKFLRMVSEPAEDKRHESLSAREKEVIVCVIKGMTNKQIAGTLHLSAHTVITHRRNISAKLDIHSTAGLTIYAIVNKLVDLKDVGEMQEGVEQD